MNQNEVPNLQAERFNEAVGLQTAGQIDKAVALYERILGEEPEHSDALHLLGLCKHQLGDSQAGISLIKKAIEINPADAAYRSNLGSAYKALGQFEEAIETLEEAIRLDAVFLPAFFNIGELYSLTDQLERGEESYRRALELNSELPDVWANLGICLAKQNKLEESESCLLKALEMYPDFGAALFALGHVREEQGRLQEAQQLYIQSMNFGLDRASTLRRLATLSQSLKQPEQAIEYLNELIAMDEADAAVYNNLSLAYQDLEDSDKAKAALKRALELDGEHVESLCNMAAILNEMGDFEKSIETSRKCLGIDPDCDIAHNNLASSLKALSRLDESIQSYKRAIAIEPERAEYHNNLALVCEYRGRIEEMETEYREAIRLDPDYAVCLANYGAALLNFGRMGEAKEKLDRALAIDSKIPVAWNNLARYYYEMGFPEESLEAYGNYLELEPDSPLGLTSLAATQIARDSIDERTIYQQHVENALKLCKGIEPYAHEPATRARSAGERLRIGFISPDFRRHSVAYFLEPLLKKLDREKYSVHCYSIVFNKDDVTQRIESLSDQWRDVCELPEERLAKVIHEDEIDILFDLAGFTATNKIATFAYKPAPVQATWLGYPHSTGMKPIDYRLVDDVTDPEGVTLNTETLARLPGCFLCYAPPEEYPEVEPPPSLENGYITFGSFNNLTKLSEQSIRIYAKVLEAVPRSRFLIKCHQSSDESVRALLLERFAKNGIGEDRIEFLSRVASTKGHLVSYHRMDIALDTHPYNGTTTTCEAMWMGVPVVTLQGQRHASRVSSSLLQAVGLDECVVETEEAFVQKAVQMASHPAKLEEKRRKLRPMFEGSVLRDETRFAKEFDKVLNEMWRSFVDAS